MQPRNDAQQLEPAVPVLMVDLVMSAMPLPQVAARHLAQRRLARVRFLLLA